MPESAMANPAMANPAMAKSKRQIVSSIEDGPTEYDRENYHSHLIEQYKLYVEMVDRLSARRVLVNNSFITLNGAGAIAFAAAPTSFGGGPAVFFQAAITLACILLSVLWRETIVYYRHLSDAKFQVIHEMEELLPARPYTVEHEYFIGKRKAKLTPFTRGLSDMEIYIPIIAAIAAGSALIYTLLVPARPYYAMLFGA
jgi:hypothetical protein